jgi:hypothetical protein
VRETSPKEGFLLKNCCFSANEMVLVMAAHLQLSTFKHEQHLLETKKEGGVRGI